MADAKNEPKEQLKPVAPGTVVTPGSAPVAIPNDALTQTEPEPATALPPPEQPAPAPQPQPVEPPQTPKQPSAPAATEPAAEPEAAHYQVNPSVQDEDEAISWTASEFIAHDKSPEWYMLLALGTAAAAAIMYLVTRDFISVGVVIIAAFIFGIYGSHKPRQLQYRIDLRGLTIGAKTYSFDDFQSFSIIPEGAFSSVVFMPLKRLSAPLSIFYAPQDEDKIIELLSIQLPYEQRRRDAVDTLMRKVRF